MFVHLDFICQNQLLQPYLNVFDLQNLSQIIFHKNTTDNYLIKLPFEIWKILFQYIHIFDVQILNDSLYIFNRQYIFEFYNIWNNDCVLHIRMPREFPFSEVKLNITSIISSQLNIEESKNVRQSQKLRSIEYLELCTKIHKLLKLLKSKRNQLICTQICLWGFYICDSSFFQKDCKLFFQEISNLIGNNEMMFRDTRLLPIDRETQFLMRSLEPILVHASNPMKRYGLIPPKLFSDHWYNDKVGYYDDDVKKEYESIKNMKYKKNRYIHFLIFFAFINSNKSFWIQKSRIQLGWCCEKCVWEHKIKKIKLSGMLFKRSLSC